ncbi:MAG: methionyl-tRNA formyltransferase [Mycoplasmataceae bacterium]|nr:methionyl-tRNA formyltransferase [Mycoplasmataceae bacterium]
MKIILAGSPEISVPAFEEVIKNFEVVAVITNPDRKSGRGMKLNETPVSKLANDHSIKVFKPNKISEIYSELKDIQFDLLLSFAFGQYIPGNILSLGTHKPLNIHGSLLPKYRGAAPIHYAILNGDKEIGITLMEMVKEMDAGDMYFKASNNIDESTTVGDGFKIISKLAQDNIVEWISSLNIANPQKQGEDFSLSPKIDKNEAELKSKDSMMINLRKIRGMNPFPGAFIKKEKRIKIFDATFDNIDKSVEIICSDGTLYATKYQVESKKITTL